MSAKRYCLIGAGPCGLAMVKNFKERGIPFDCFEREADVGGIWNPESPSAVYERTHLNTSKRLSRYTDFPMPGKYPQFLSCVQAREYIRSYANNFNLYDAITFNTAVEKAEEHDGKWHVSVTGEKTPRVYDGLVVSNGHHWDAKWPDYPGTFKGEILHSIEVKSRKQLQGKRVLVVGSGNTGADLAADAAQIADASFHSMKRGYYFLPKFAFGRPLDQFLDLTQRWPVPRRFLRWMYSVGLYLIVGPYEKYGLPKPDHALLESHPNSASAYLDHAAHGRITNKPDIERLDGKKVIFKDGSEEEIDLIIYATGYHVTYPFMDKGLFVREDESTPLFLYTFHRKRDDLFHSGLVQPADGGFWQLADYQGQLVSTYLVACERDPAKAAWFRKLKETAHPATDHGVKYIDSARHKFEVQHYRYRSYCQKLLKKFGPLTKAKWPGSDEGSGASEKTAELELAS